MAGTETKRIIELTEASTVQSGDFIAVDSNARGTKKVSTDTLATSAALAAEQTARQQADTTLDGKITAEAQARTGADNTLGGQVADLKSEFNYDYDYVTKVTRNLFDGRWFIGGIDSSTGADYPEQTSQQHTSYIPVEDNEQYMISSSMEDIYTIYAFYYDSSKDFLSYETVPYGLFPRTITTPNDAAYLRLVDSISASNTNYQVEKGDNATDYVPHRLIKFDSLEDGDVIQETIVAVDEVTDHVTGKNLFFSEWSESGKGLDLDTGAEKYHTSWRRTGYVEVEEQKTYTASCVFEDAPAVYMFYYDETKDFISKYQTTYGFYPKTFTTPANTKYVRVLHTSGGLPTNYQIELGSSATTYESPYKEYVVPSSKVRGSIVSDNISISGKKWLFLGDSITADSTSNGWVYKFKELVGANANSYIQAVGGATWCDGEAGITYNGKPYQSQNYVGNQVAWCQSIGFASNAFDCIIISAGTNDTNANYPTDADVEAQFYSGGTLKSLSNVDRTTWAGCIRWTVETLRSLYPNAVIVLVTPLQRKVAMDGSTPADMYPTIRQKRETIVKMAHRMGVHCINMDEVNITDMDSSDFADGLHPNSSGTTKMANYIFRKIMPIMCEYNL